jgi:ribosome biogenesis GTPase / thiamine phosphate phosphatase
MYPTLEGELVLDLKELGWDEGFAEQFAPYAAQGFEPGRVSIQHRGAYDVLTERGEIRCDIRGRLFDEADSPADLPAVGDWVALSVHPGEQTGTVEGLLPRRSRFSRKTAWQASEEQVIAANVDVVFLTSSLNEDLNLRRLERYLILARESGAQPVVVLTKADLHPDPDAAVRQIEELADDVPVIAISSRSGIGLEAVRNYLEPGVTAALLGSSGVGKSTLVNTLVGEEILETKEIRDDGKGRHTTSHRELVRLPGGALIIDTPGMRELQLWVADEGLEETFSDVTSLFAHCRFADCAHDQEPGCAVKAALADGTLAPERWESYLKLEAELAHLERRLDKRALSAERKRWKTLTAEGRAASRAKRGRPE